MAKNTYFYHVTAPDGDHIIEAGSKAAAINHVVRNTVTARNLTASELMYLMREKNLKPVTANAEAADDAPAKTETKKPTHNEEKSNEQ